MLLITTFPYLFMTVCNETSPLHTCTQTVHTSTNVLNGPKSLHRCTETVHKYDFEECDKSRKLAYVFVSCRFSYKYVKYASANREICTVLVHVCKRAGLILC